MSTTHAIGIDLGTTYSAVARLDEAGRSAMVRNIQGDLLTPSVVLFDDDDFVVGRDAKKTLVTDPDRVADCPKRDMGQPHYRHKIRGGYFPPEVIQACILRRLGADVAAAIGGNFKVVITVPAYFDEPRRKATADAGEMASLAVLDIVNEPMAAALAFGEQLGYLDPAGCVRQPMKVLVYDLGGGTFDVSLIELAAGSFRTLATDGDVQLGGRDWDARLRNYAAEEFVKKHGRDPRENNLALGRLDRAAEEAKHTLSVRDRADIHVEHAGRACDLSVTRSLFEELTADLLQRTAHTTRQMFSGGRYAWRDVSYVLLVGGSTRMPMVARMLRELSELEPQHGVNPDEAVARGAAIYAGYLLAQDDARRPGARFRVVDVNAHSLGIESIEAETLRKQNVIRWKKAVTDGAGFEPLARLIADVQPTANPAMPTWLQQNLLAAQQDPAAAPPQMLAPAAAETKWPSTGPSLIIPAGESGDGYALQETDEPQQNYAPQQEYATQQEYGPQADATPQASGFSAEYPAAHEPTDEGDDLTGPYVRPKRRKSSATARTVVNLVAHVMSSVLGLSLGYYILCWIKPESNFLHLNLPLLPPAVSEKPATPDAPSAAPRKP